MEDYGGKCHRWSVKSYGGSTLKLQDRRTCLPLAAARKYAFITCMCLLGVINMCLLMVIQYVHGLVESVVQGHHICKRVWYPTVCGVLKFTCKDRNDDCFASGVGLPHMFVGGWPSRVAWKVQGASAHAIFITHKHKSTNLICVHAK